MDVTGSPYAGVYAAASEERLFVPVVIEEEPASRVGEALGLEPVRLSLGGSTILGSLMALNSRGAMVPSFVDVAELEILRTHMEVGLVEGRMNACGNNMLVGEKAALVNPRLDADPCLNFGRQDRVPILAGLFFKKFN